MSGSLLYLHTTLAGPPRPYARALFGDLHGMLRSALGLSADEPDREGSFSMTAGADEPETESHQLQAACRAALAAPTSCHVILHWHAVSGTAGFPDFDGVLTLEPDRAGATSLHLTGQLRFAADEPDVAHERDAYAVADRVLRGVEAELQRLDAPSADTTPRAATRYRVRDLMRTGPLTFREDLPLEVAVLLLLDKEARGAPVVDEAGEVVGVLTESDLLAKEAAPRLRRGPAAREEQRRRLADRVGEACTRPAVTISPDAAVRTAARELLDRDVSLLVAVEGDRVLGVLTRHDVLRALAHSAEELQAAVDDIVAGETLDGELRARVTGFGHVELEGSVAARSVLDRVVGATMGLDAISEVRADAVDWERDDTGG